MITALHGDSFLRLLDRCFPCTTIPSEHQDIILTSILAGEVHFASNEDDKTLIDEKNESMRHLRRAGILSPTGEFTSPAGSWFYYNKLFPTRGTKKPGDIDELIEEAVQKISVEQICATCDNGNFPLEISFQHLFYNAFCLVMPLPYIILPEKHTQTTIAGRVQEGRVDFYINSTLQWSIELLRRGNRMSEHLNRFHTLAGKYREVATKQYLVVDCRGPKGEKGDGISPPHENPNLCTLYFAKDFRTCVCKMRGKPEKTLHLQQLIPSSSSTSPASLSSPPRPLRPSHPPHPPALPLHPSKS